MLLQRLNEAHNDVYPAVFIYGYFIMNRGLIIFDCVYFNDVFEFAGK